MSKTIRMEGWVARDQSGFLSVFPEYPERVKAYGEWLGGMYITKLPRDSFPEITWESEPKKVILTVTEAEQ